MLEQRGMAHHGRPLVRQAAPVGPRSADPSAAEVALEAALTEV